MADAHLGYEQYHQPFRAEDFARSFRSAVETAVKENVDFVLMCGDVFHKSNPNPKTIKQAIDILTILKRENVPVFAVEGNHDKTIKDLSIYDLLESLGLLFKLGLRRRFRKNEFLKSKPLGELNLVYADFDGLKIFGDTHRSSHHFRLLMEDRYLPDCDVLALHLSVKEVVDFEVKDDYVTVADLPKARYYALGHIHIPISKKIGDSWFVYPGCPERYDAREYSKRIEYFESLKVFEGCRKGFFVVNGFKPRFVEVESRELVLANVFAKDQREAVEKVREIQDLLSPESILVLKVFGENVNIEDLRSIVERRVKSLRISFEKVQRERKIEIKKLNEVFDEFELGLLEYLKRSDFESLMDVVVGYVEREFGIGEFKTLTEFEGGKSEEVKVEEKPTKPKGKRTLLDFLGG